MDKLSELIREAKPLYKKRKRQKAFSKTFLTISTCAILFGGMFQLYEQGNNIYLTFENNDLQYELLDDEYDFLRY